MDNLAHLLACCRYDVGVAVTRAGNTDSSGEIEVLFAVGRVDPAAKGMVDDDGSSLLEEGTESCHGFILS
jgi:hypothetical protein